MVELDCNPENYFAEIEQAAFSPSNVVPGIGFSPDKVLQARTFAYADAHRYRLGTHYETLPVNLPQCPVWHYHKDGAMRFFANDPGNPDAYYEPNSVGGPAEDAGYREPPLKISGDADRYDHRHGNDDHGQPRALFELFDDSQRQRLFSNIADSMQGVPTPIVERQLAHFRRVHPDYAEGVARALGMPATMGGPLSGHSRRGPLHRRLAGGGLAGAANGGPDRGASGRAGFRTGFARRENRR